MLKQTITSLIGLALGSSAIPFSLANTDTKSETELFINQEQEILLNIYKVTFPDKNTTRDAMISFHGQLLESSINDNYLILELSKTDKERLKAIEKQQKIVIPIEPATEWIEKRHNELNEIKQEMFQPSEKSGTDSTSRAKGIEGFQCYETVEETFIAAQDIAKKFPKLAKWEDAGDSWQKQQGSNKGYDIKVLKLTNNEKNVDKPKLFLNSGLHAREYATAPLALAFARYLTDNYGKNADVTWILDHHEVHFMLHSNPDGRKIAENRVTKFKRKNTNNNVQCSRLVKNGIDLNRNFSHGWKTVPNGSSGNACDDTYRGISSASEPETQAVQSYMRSLWQDNRGPGKNDKAPRNTSGIFIDIHSHGGLVLWPWGDSRQAAPNGTELQTLGRRFAWFNKYSPKQASGLYPTDGASDDFAYGDLGVAGFTFELGLAGTFFEPCSSFERSVKPDNLKALLYAAKVVRTPYITPSGPETLDLTLSSSTTNVVAGTQVNLTAKVTDANFNQSNGKEGTQAITEAQFSIDKPFWENHTAVPLEAKDGQFNSPTEDITGSIDTTSLTAGRHTVYVRAKDRNGNWGPVSAEFLNIEKGDGDGDNTDNGKYTYKDSSVRPIKSKKYAFSKPITIPQNAPKASSARVKFTVKHPNHGRLYIAMINRSNDYFWAMKASQTNTTDGQQTYSQTIPTSILNKLKSNDWFLAIYDTKGPEKETGLLLNWSIQLMP